jgi:hypothetical protein
MRIRLPSTIFRGNLLDPMHRLLAIALLLVITAPVQAAYQQEHIVVSGGVSLYQWEKFKNPPHDLWWGNFIRPAVTRFQQIKDADKNARITWLVHRPSYERRLRQNEGPLTSWIANIAPKYGVKLIWFSSPDTVINYLNGGQPRNAVKIAIFAPKALVKSWGCHTGESMSKKWRRATGVPMVGAVGKTDYSVMYRNEWLPGLSRGRWTR